MTCVCTFNKTRYTETSHLLPCFGSLFLAALTFCLLGVFGGNIRADEGNRQMFLCVFVLDLGLWGDFSQHRVDLCVFVHSVCISALLWLIQSMCVCRLTYGCIHLWTGARRSLCLWCITIRFWFMEKIILEKQRVIFQNEQLLTEFFQNPWRFTIWIK